MSMPSTQQHDTPSVNLCLTARYGASAALDIRSIPPDRSKPAPDPVAARFQALMPLALMTSAAPRPSGTRDRLLSLGRLPYP